MLKRIFIVTSFCVLFAGYAAAQLTWTKVATFDAPFDFVVSDTELPAGHYVVRTYSTGKFIMVQNADTSQCAYAQNSDVMLPPSQVQQTTKAVFGLNHNGKQVLHQVCIEGDDHTHDLIHSKNVTELVRTELKATQ